MASKQSSASDPTSSNDASGEPRRNFVFEGITILIGGLVGAVPFLFGLFNFLDPIFRKRKKPRWYASQGGADDEYVRISSLDALGEEGPPQRFPVIADKRDAWDYVPNQAIGAVFVERMGSDVRVFNATCPHAGCSVSCNGNSYHCPCHNSAFDLDGSKMASDSGRNNPSPRALDSLEVDPVRLENDREVWVKFQNFYTGKHEKKPKS